MVLYLKDANIEKVVPTVQHARAELVNFCMERWAEPSSLESAYFFSMDSMVLKLCQSRVRRDCSPSKQSKLLHAQEYIEMERETFGGLRHRFFGVQHFKDAHGSEF